MEEENGDGAVGEAVAAERVRRGVRVFHGGHEGGGVAAGDWDVEDLTRCAGAEVTRVGHVAVLEGIFAAGAGAAFAAGGGGFRGLGRCL